MWLCGIKRVGVKSEKIEEKMIQGKVEARMDSEVEFEHKYLLYWYHPLI